MTKKKTCRCKSIDGVGKAHTLNCVFGKKKKTVNNRKGGYSIGTLKTLAKDFILASADPWEQYARQRIMDEFLSEL